jgi:hypothetical protein
MDWQSYRNKLKSIYADLIVVLNDHEVFKHFRATVIENFEWVRDRNILDLAEFVIQRSGRDYLFMAITRQTEDNGNSIFSLLSSIKNDIERSEITFDSYQKENADYFKSKMVGLPGDIRDSWSGLGCFRNLSKDDKVMSIEIVQQDINTLNNDITKRIRKFAFGNIINYNTDPTNNTQVLYSEIGDVLDNFEKLFIKYTEFFEQETWGALKYPGRTFLFSRYPLMKPNDEVVRAFDKQYRKYLNTGKWSD